LGFGEAGVELDDDEGRQPNRRGMWSAEWRALPRLLSGLPQRIVMQCSVAEGVRRMEGRMEGGKGGMGVGQRSYISILV
jgi:hypothetical protein